MSWKNEVCCYVAKKHHSLPHAIRWCLYLLFHVCAFLIVVGLSIIAWHLPLINTAMSVCTVVLTGYVVVFSYKAVKGK